MKIDIETVVKARLPKVWEAWNDPEDIKRWNAASPDWHTTKSTVDLREGGKFSRRSTVLLVVCQSGDAAFQRLMSSGSFQASQTLGSLAFTTVSMSIFMGWLVQARCFQ